MVNKCCLQNTSWEIVNVLARLQFERDESKGARSQDSSRSNGHAETWGEYSQLNMIISRISQDNTSTPCFFFHFTIFP